MYWGILPWVLTILSLLQVKLPSFIEEDMRPRAEKSCLSSTLRFKPSQTPEPMLPPTMRSCPPSILLPGVLRSYPRPEWHDETDEIVIIIVAAAATDIH